MTIMLLHRIPPEGKKSLLHNIADIEKSKDANVIQQRVLLIRGVIMAGVIKHFKALLSQSRVEHLQREQKRLVLNCLGNTFRQTMRSTTKWKARHTKTENVTTYTNALKHTPDGIETLIETVEQQKEDSEERLQMKQDFEKSRTKIALEAALDHSKRSSRRLLKRLLNEKQVLRNECRCESEKQIE